MMPLAPVRFSTTNGCFRPSVSRCARMRAVMSTPPPGANGTTMRTGLVGYGCASAAGAATAKSKVRQSFRIGAILFLGSRCIIEEVISQRGYAMNAIEQHLASMLSRNWWVLLLRGIAAIAFGFLTWWMPGISLKVLLLVFGAYALADGILGVWMAVASYSKIEHWWVMLLGGLVSIGAGILTFLAPGVTALVLLFYIAAWAIVTGVLEIVAAIRLRKEIEGEWMLILAGLCSLLFGFVLIARPALGALAVVWMIGIYAIAFGAMLILIRFRVKTLRGCAIWA